MCTCMCANIGMVKSVYAWRGWAPVCSVQLVVLLHTSVCQAEETATTGIGGLALKMVSGRATAGSWLCTWSSRRHYLRVGELEHA
jgi:hypothetical protein